MNGSAPPPPPLSTSPQCGLDRPSGDSGCSPFEKLDAGPFFGRVKRRGPQDRGKKRRRREEHAELSTAPTISITKEEAGELM